MITYDMNMRGGMSKYEYLFQCIRRDIQSGAMPPDFRLPSKRSLAEHLMVSVTTVENAYSMLVSEGYLYTKQSSGFFVCRRPLPPPQADEPEEEEASPYRFDFKANRCSLSLFPMNTWTRLMRQVLSRQDPVLLQTVPFNGLYVLRQAIAGYLYEYRGMSVSPGQIVIGAGTEYLYGRLLQLFGPHNVIAIEDPGYKKFADISLSYGGWGYLNYDAAADADYYMDMVRGGSYDGDEESVLRLLPFVDWSGLGPDGWNALYQIIDGCCLTEGRVYGPEETRMWSNVYPDDQAYRDAYVMLAALNADGAYAEGLAEILKKQRDYDADSFELALSALNSGQRETIEGLIK